MTVKKVSHDEITKWLYQDEIITDICKTYIPFIKSIDTAYKQIISMVKKKIIEKVNLRLIKAIEYDINIKMKEMEYAVTNSRNYLIGNIDLLVQAEMVYSSLYEKIRYMKNLEDLFVSLDKFYKHKYWNFSLIFESKSFYELSSKPHSEILRQLNKYRDNIKCVVPRYSFLVGEKLKSNTFNRFCQIIKDHGWQFLETPFSLGLDKHQRSIDGFL